MHLWCSCFISYIILHDVVVEELHPIIICSSTLPLHRLLVGILHYYTYRGILPLIGWVSTQDSVLNHLGGISTNSRSHIIGGRGLELFPGHQSCAYISVDFLTRDFWCIVLNDLDLFVHYYTLKARQTRLKFCRAEFRLRREHIREKRSQSYRSACISSVI